MARGSRIPWDAAYQNLLGAFALFVFVVAALIVYECARGASPAVLAYGWRFPGPRAWGPVAQDLGAPPYLFGAPMSPGLAPPPPLALGLRTAAVPRRARTQGRRQSRLVRHRGAGLHSKYCVRHLGILRARALPAHGDRALARLAPGFHSALPGLSLRHRHARRGHRARYHDPAHHRVPDARAPPGHAALAA